MFSCVTEAPVDPILGVELAYQKDTCPDKVNLGVGAYRTENGDPYVFSVVRDVEKVLANDPELYKEYSSIDGPSELKPLTQKMVFGPYCKAVTEERLVSMQALSGTGALKLVADFLKRNIPAVKTIYVSNPTWGNHNQIFKLSGLNVESYPYWNQEKKCFDFEALLSFIKTIPSHQVILLHACAHNPTGMDPTKEQWVEIKDAILEANLIPVLDSAYQGFASGDLDNDAFSIRLFESSCNEMFVCQSFAKNLGLYGERIGMVHVVTKSKDDAARVLSQLKICARATYSTPPIHGAQLLLGVLSDENNYNRWTNELAEVSGRLASIRKQLRAEIEKQTTPGDWSHITAQIGMFSFTGLTPAQCDVMTNKHHIYMVKNGRISMAGLNKKNVDYVAKAIDDVVRNVK